ncbi:hypothetical protein GW17_00004266 [Ensete ventricosum]|nr:hypothetical protein GW17_00004266 [Ensete ventricosum]
MPLQALPMPVGAMPAGAAPTNDRSCYYAAPCRPAANAAPVTWPRASNAPCGLAMGGHPYKRPWPLSTTPTSGLVVGGRLSKAPTNR